MKLMEIISKCYIYKIVKNISYSISFVNNSRLHLVLHSGESLQAIAIIPVLFWFSENLLLTQKQWAVWTPFQHGTQTVFVSSIFSENQFCLGITQLLVFQNFFRLSYWNQNKNVTILVIFYLLLNKNIKTTSNIFFTFNFDFPTIQIT